MQISPILLRFTNTALLGLVLLLTVTGLYGIIWILNGWVFEVHRAAGWAVIALLPLKAVIAVRSLQRGLTPGIKRGPTISVALGTVFLLIVVLLSGVLWAWRAGPVVLWLRQTTISWHWMLALILLIPFALHTWQRWPHPKMKEFASRRGVFRLGALTAAGTAGWWAAEWLARSRATLEFPRHFTGSRGDGLYAGNDFPITGEWADEIDAEQWSLKVAGAVRSPARLRYTDLLDRPMRQMTATIDCTTGWYSVQNWQGTSLTDLLREAGLHPEARIVQLKAITGYTQFFGLLEAEQILLATHVGGEVLRHWHGYPVRAVVPSRRGWFWVKWLSEIKVLTRLPTLDDLT